MGSTGATNDRFLTDEDVHYISVVLYTGFVTGLRIFLTYIESNC